jgi:hypothetical protein
LLAGKPPFHTGDVAWQISEAEPKPVNSRLATLDRDPVPAEWEETIQACLAKEPEDRPNSASEVAQRLNLTADVREPLRRSRTNDEQTGGTADFTDGADEKKAGRAARGAESERARQNIDDEATRRGMRQPTLPPQGTKRTSRLLMVAGLAALGLGVLAYAFWPRSTVRPEAKTQAARVVPSVPSEPREFTVTVDPPDVGARLWLGPLSDVEIKDGKALLKEVPDGEQELTVQAPGYQPFTTRVTVKNGRGSFEAKLVPVRGAVTVTARHAGDRGGRARAGDARGQRAAGRRARRCESADRGPVYAQARAR